MKKDIKFNVFVSIVRTLTLTLVSFLTFPYVSSTLGDNYLGAYTWANTFVYFFLILARISIPNIAVRECVKVKDDKVELARKTKLFFVMQLITTALSFVSLLVIVLTIPGVRNMNQEILGENGMGNLIFILSINFLAGVFSFEWLYTALEKHFYMAVRSIIAMAISSILIFSFIRYKEHVYIYSLFTVGVTIITVISNLIFIPKYIHFKGVGIASPKPYFRPILTMLLITIVLAIYNEGDMLLLGIMDAKKSETGAHTIAMRGIEIIITVITSLNMVFMPRASDYVVKGEEEKYNELVKYSMNLCFFIAIPAIATMVGTSETITALISGNGNVSREFLITAEQLEEFEMHFEEGKAFANAWIILCFLSPLMLTYSIGDIIYTQVLIPYKKERIYLIVLGIATILMLGFSALLGLTFFKAVPGLGVAISVGAMDIFAFILLFILTKNKTRKAIFNLNNLKIVVVGVIIGVFTFFVGPIIRNALYQANNDFVASLLLELVIIVLIDAFIYIGTLYILKENLVRDLLHFKHKSN